MARSIVVGRWPGKTRGVRRKLRDVLALPDVLNEMDFPEPHPGREYWSLKIPAPQELVEGPLATRKLVKTCMRAFLDACFVLRTKNPKETPNIWIFHDYPFNAGKQA